MNGKIVFFRFLTLFAAAFALLSAHSAWAARIRAAPHENYGRIVFDWDRSVTYAVQASGLNVRLVFSQPLDDDPANIPLLLSDFVAAVSLSSDRKALTLTLKTPAGPQAFPLGMSVVVDLIKGKSTPNIPPIPADADIAGPPPPSPAPHAPLVPVRVMPEADATRLTFEWPEPTSFRMEQDADSVRLLFGTPAEIDLPALNANIPEAFRPIRAEQGQGGLIVTIPLPEGADLRRSVAGSKTTLELILPPTSSDAAKASETAPEADVPPPPAAAPPETPPSPSPSALSAPLPPPRRPSSAPVASLSFSWSDQTGAAAFERGGWLWLVFDRPLQVDVPLLAQMGKNAASRIEQLESDKKSTVVRILTNPGYAPSLRREGLLWIVDLMEQPLQPAYPLNVEMHAESPVGPRIFIPTTNPSQPIVLEDPEIGDRFIVVPISALGSGIYPEWKTPDLTLPITAQGIVVNPISDRIAVNRMFSGVEISGQGGLNLSPNIAEAGEFARIGSETDLKRVFDIQNWMRGDEDQFLRNKQLLQLAVASAPAERRENARLDLARFFFSHGFNPETLGILGVIAQDRPEAENTAAFRALRGATNLLMGRYDEAIADLSHSSLSATDETAFWLALARSRVSPPAAQAPFLQQHGAVLARYPRWVKAPLALMAAEAAVAADNDVAASNFLSAARYSDNTPHELAATSYLEGRMAEASGLHEAAKQDYAQVTEGQDRFYQALAKKALLELMYQLHEIDRPNLVKGLENLRLSWRGGSFERDLLMRLAELYSEEENWGMALRTWQQVASYFPDQDGSKDNPDSSVKKMQDIYEKLYFDGLADKMTPIAAIALFDEFRELIPSGPKGDEMIRRLADRLASVDLLPQAARLLERQIAYRVEGADKAKIGARLGLLYLLDRQPEKATEALLKTKEDKLPDPLERQRQQLMARALSDLGRPQEAIALLEQDQSRTADLLRAEIYWHAQNWQAAADVLEKLTPLPSPALELGDSQARMILDRATALTLARNDRAVTALRNAYLPLMNKTSYKEAFDLLTSPTESGTIDYKTIAERIKKVEDFKAFLQGYRDTLAGDGLSAIN